MTNAIRLGLAAVSPYAAVLALAAAGAAAWCRRTVLAIATLCVALVGIGIQISWYYVARPAGPTGSGTLRLLSANIRNGDVDTYAFTRAAVAGADVIIVVELTPAAAQRFSDAGLSQTFPYSHLIPAPMAGGIGMWSRFPLVGLTVPKHPFAAVPAALVDVPGVGRKTVVVGVHVKSPFAAGQDTVKDWRSGIAHVKNEMARHATASGAGAVVVAGDFNCTPDIWQFRDLLDTGYQDSVRALGAGFAPTFPAGRRLPPLATLDHVLARNSAATAIETVDIPGSDHRGLRATIAIPAGA